ncbi:uncharacterized protein KY384_003508 [Bacidia gigantensis]|uniref:uncharacterized protein n=1 Tax=Bacidia gigantensis TaxID=2732470 RepID=UPI001D047423|nr:uncharacterized protein KY384_003508 [Bacidia gigantensis]KAG8531872.1 hypothetical protein KY384_003508 [Bacidia gigantensis]
MPRSRSSVSTAPPSASTTAPHPPSTNAPSSAPLLPAPTFPPHTLPRTWLITSALTPIGQSVARHALRHGDNVVGCVPNYLPSVDIPGVEELLGGWEKFEEDIERGGLEGKGEGRGSGAGIEGIEHGERNAGGEEMVGEGEEDAEGEEDDGGEENCEDVESEAEKTKGAAAGQRNGVGKGKVMKPWKERWKKVGLDGRSVGQCQAAVAEAQASFGGGGADILFCCDGEALFGTVEELAASVRTQSLVREQFETNFYGPVNCIRAVLPSMRKKGSGHIVLLSSIINHLGTPGLATTCASGWALDGFCDSLAYEVAPFNIKISIVQPSMEVNLLTHKITAVPPSEHYSPDLNSIPTSREMIGGLLDRIEGSGSRRDPRKLTGEHTECLYPRLPAEMVESLIAETVHAVLAIGGHDNPPARHIVGFEGVATVKEKLKTVSEELEEFVAVSCAVDIDQEGQAVNGQDESLDEDT